IVHCVFFFQAEDGIRDFHVTGVQTCALPISTGRRRPADIVMLGTFGVWTRGTLQSRALPFARAITASTGLDVAIVTTPWDAPDEIGRASCRERNEITRETV